ncbi:transcription antitermination protein NusB, partial [Streptomyces sp. NPDC050619]|uniref:transcription antitermination protein NusB n=1 Tax=Streptomyces sp. NPDC050619 TaxID=3157214 RepID=UPI00343C06A3
MAARNTARKRAFQILFEGDQRGADVLTVLADWIRLSRDDTRQPPVSEYTMQLIEGYAQHAKRIDELIAQYSVGWTLDRMPVVDRNILRLGAYELIWMDDHGRTGPPGQRRRLGERPRTRATTGRQGTEGG